jgi:Holliday junction resolvase RusA-like endonuclease
MKKLTLQLYGNVPSKKNSKRRVQRGAHIFMVPSKNHEDWHAMQMAYIASSEFVREYKCHFPIVYTECVTLTFYPPDRRASDATNKAESVMDLLVDAGVLKDDNWFIVRKVTTGLGDVDKSRPRVEVEILLSE